MEMISSNMNKTVSIAVANRNISTIYFTIFCLSSGIKLQFYNGIVKLGEITTTGAVTMQTLTKSLDLTGVSTLTIKTDSKVLFLGDLSFDYGTAFTFPGMSILNFRWLPETVCPSITAASFDTPANVVIDEGGLAVLGEHTIQLLNDFTLFDHVEIYMGASLPDSGQMMQIIVDANAVAMAQIAADEFAINRSNRVIPTGEKALINSEFPDTVIYFKIKSEGAGAVIDARIIKMLILMYN